jgi:hypothetical protein
MSKIDYYIPPDHPDLRALTLGLGAVDICETLDRRISRGVYVL